MIGKKFFTGMTYLINERWSINGGGRHNLLINKMINARGNIMYQNECLRIIATIDRQFTRDRDIEPNTTASLQLLLRNLN